jgi:hypothetical protein
MFALISDQYSRQAARASLVFAKAESSASSKNSYALVVKAEEDPFCHSEVSLMPPNVKAHRRAAFWRVRVERKVGRHYGTHLFRSGITAPSPRGFAFSDGPAFRKRPGETFQCSPRSVITVTVFLSIIEIDQLRFSEAINIDLHRSSFVSSCPTAIPLVTPNIE